MFAPLPSEITPKQYLTVAVILCLQMAVLVALRLLSFAPLYGSPAIRHGYRAPGVVAKLYFHPPPVAEPPKLEKQTEPPVSKPPEPETQRQVEPAEGPATSHPSESGAADGSSGALGLLMSPAPSWVFEEIPDNPLSRHQGYEEAMADRTPEPAILHRYFPEAARGREMVVDLIINEQGRVVGARVLQEIGHGVEEVLMETLSKWTFFPARVRGVAIPSQRRIRLRFPG